MTTINMTADITYTDPDDIIAVLESVGFTNVAISLPGPDTEMTADEEALMESEIAAMLYSVPLQDDDDNDIEDFMTEVAVTDNALAAQIAADNALADRAVARFAASQRR